MDSNERWSRLDLQSVLLGYANKDVAIASFGWYGLETWISPFAVDRGEAVPRIRCSRLSSKTQLTGADEDRWMDISEGRSEDSAGMAHGSNTRLQWPRAAAARAARYVTDERGLSGNGQRSAIDAVGEEEELGPLAFWSRLPLM